MTLSMPITTMETMPESGRSGGLTDKQVEILDRLERRLTIAEIAYELGISDSAVNQRIRVLKARLGANSHRVLVERYTALRRETCRFPAGRIPQLSEAGDIRNSGEREGPEPADALGVPLSPLAGPGERGGELRVVPGVLDGENAGGLRLAVIVSIVLGMFAVVVLALAAASAITDVIG